MAISGPRKAILPAANLPNLTVFDDGSFGYRTRYRIVSEDRNRFSHYSPIYDVRASFIFQRPNQRTQEDFVIQSSGPICEVRWEEVFIRDRETDNFINSVYEYDMWVKWDKGEIAPSPVGIWQFVNVTQSDAKAFRIPSSYELSDGSVVEQSPNRLSVEIYVRSTNPSRNNTALLVYKLDNQTF